MFKSPVPRAQFFPHLTVRRVLTSTLLLGAFLAPAGPLVAQGGGFVDTKTPATTVSLPGTWTGVLRPVADNPAAGIDGIVTDQTSFKFGSNLTASNPFAEDVDIENGWLFVSTGRGLTIYDVRTTPEAPVKKPTFFASTSNVPDWNQSDLKFYTFGLDAPAGYDGAVALSSVASNGMLIFDTRDKERAPLLKYQDGGKTGAQVWATTIGQSHYAFFAAQDQKILVYNMSAAQALSGNCLDISPNLATCKDAQNRKVYVGKINTQYSVDFIHGAGEYVAAAQGSAGIEIWKVTDPAVPQRVLKFSPPGSTFGVAMWQDGAKYYLATVQIANSAPRPLRIYDVSCIASGGCSQGTLLSTFDMSHAAPSANTFITFSRSGSTPFLYVGSEDQFSGTPQREYLLNVSNPAAPADVTPPAAVIPGGWGYWGWYYAGNSTGFNWVMPRGGKFHNTYFFRAAHSILDIHQYNGTASADFSYTTPSSDGKLYANDPITFTDRSTGTPTSWSWSFADGVPQPTSPPSSSQGPHIVKFAEGTKTVSLMINGDARLIKSANLTFVDPNPVVGALSMVPASPRVCQRIQFSAGSAAAPTVTGKPPLGYQWEVLKADGSPLQPAVTGASQAFEWNTSAYIGAVPGSYKARLTVNGTASASNEVPFELAAPGILVEGFQVQNQTFEGGPTVKFLVPAGQADGASEWKWDFGDGTVQKWSSDPSDLLAGPAPSHKYKTKGTFKVKLSVRNCSQFSEVGVTSAELSVTITKLTEPKAQFAVVCPFGFCSFGVGEAIQFSDASTDAEVWEYDWNGDNIFEETSTGAPKSSHTYTAAGKYRPQLRVRTADGAEISPAFPLAMELNVISNGGGGGGGGGGNPSISISGSSSATPGQSITLTANASNCTASSNGWTWQTDGGTGTSTTNSISLSWASAGAKSVTVRNSGCGSAQGARTVTVSNGGGGGGGSSLKANFTYAPVPVLQNQAVSFNGSSSTGNPTSYVWSFGDGSAPATGAQLTHTFTQKGPFTVTLSVTGVGSCPPAPFCESTSQQVIVVTSNTPLLSASFNSEICVAELNLVLCNAATGQEVTFVDASSGNVVSRTWDFGDGETTTGTPVKHTYKKAGTYQLTLTVSDGTSNNSLSRQIVVTGGPLTEAMVLPWIAKTSGALVQSSDFYLHNPGTESIDVTLAFRQRGVPEDNPPKATRTIAANATLVVSDVVKSLFGRDNISGFVAITVDRGAGQPVVMSFNTTLQKDGSEFGQTVPGYLMSNTGAASTTGNKQLQHLVGLNDNDERLSYFGLSNSSGSPAAYRLRFFDAQGHEIGTASQSIVLPPNGFKQYQSKDVRTLFGISDKDDYRVVVETDQGAPVFPYGANVRKASDDPSFVSVGTGASRVFLLGALSTPGANNSIWQSDLVIANTGTQVAIVDITFNNVGLTSAPTDTIHETLQPGETRRLTDVIGTKWNIRNGVGVLTIDSDAPGDLFPVVQGESYENTNPAKRFGQTLPGLTEKQAAGPNQGQYLVGLRQDAKYRTTFWVFNPGPGNGEYEIVFRTLDGQELGRVPNFSVGAGKARQFNQAQFPAGLNGSFTAQVFVKSGKVLTAAQVVNNATNDPAYIQGETR